MRIVVTIHSLDAKRDSVQVGTSISLDATREDTSIVARAVPLTFSKPMFALVSLQNQICAALEQLHEKTAMHEQQEENQNANGPVMTTSQVDALAHSTATLTMSATRCALLLDRHEDDVSPPESTMVFAQDYFPTGGCFASDFRTNWAAAKINTNEIPSCSPHSTFSCALPVTAQTITGDTVHGSSASVLFNNTFNCNTNRHEQI